jgi:hypothetical protein
VRQLRSALEAQREEYASIRDGATLSEWCDVFLKGRKSDVREGTLEGYESLLETFIKPTLGTKRLAAITVADLERLKSDPLTHVPAAVASVRLRWNRGRMAGEVTWPPARGTHGRQSPHRAYDGL